MLTINELKRGTIFELEGQPHVVLEYHHVKIGRGGAVLQTKIKNLITRATISRNFKQADRFEEVEIEKKDAVFIYEGHGGYWFHYAEDKSNRFSLTEDLISEEKRFLKSDLAVQVHTYKEKVIRIVLPVKIEYTVTEAPPVMRGNTSEGGNKTVIIETGATIQTPLFIEEGDTILVNTETGEYVERIKKVGL